MKLLGGRVAAAVIGLFMLGIGSSAAAPFTVIAVRHASAEDSAASSRLVRRPYSSASAPQGSIRLTGLLET